MDNSKKSQTQASPVPGSTTPKLKVPLKEAETKPITPSRRKTIDRRDDRERNEFEGQERRLAEDRRQKQDDKKKGGTRSLELSRHQERVQQYRKKKLLAGCESVMSFHYDTLAMDDYPSNEAVAAAKKDRDQWIALCSVFTSVFLLGFTALIPAIIAGIACGSAALTFSLAFTPLRTKFFDAPPLSELLALRKQIEFKALTHIRYLESPHGLAWRCEKMKKYNSNLDRKLFRGMILRSKEQNLLQVIRTKKQIRLYLLYMIEAQKAYKRLQKDYLENHFKHLDQGWDDSLDSKEIAQVEQEDRGSSDSDVDVPEPTVTRKLRRK